MTAEGTMVTGTGGDRSVDALTRADIVAAGLLCAAMCATFWVFGSGTSLRVTFVPGALVAYTVLVMMFVRSDAPDVPTRVLPVYMVAVGWQGVHFAEEFQTGFQHRFPELYGGGPYGTELFIWFNMGSYALFLVAAVAALVGGVRPLLMPAMFFVVYGTLGNSVAHVTWAVMAGGYFPGLFTSLAYVVIGPVLIRRMWPGAGWAGAGWVTVGLAGSLVPLLVLCAEV